MDDFFKKIQDKLNEVTKPEYILGAVKASGLFAVVKAKDKKRIEYFVRKKGYNINEYSPHGLTPFHEAVKTGSVSLVKFLIDLGADYNLPMKMPFPYDNPVHLAVTGNHPQMIRFLRSLGFSVNTPSPRNQWTPLDQAMQENKPVIARALIEVGANPVTFNDQGRNPILTAVLFNKQDMVQVLLDNPRAQIGFSSKFYQVKKQKTKPPFLTAIEKHYHEIVEMMLEKGFDVNQRDRENRTPLHHAIAVQDEQCIRLLLKHGADINEAKDIYGNTPFHDLCRMQSNFKKDVFDQVFRSMVDYGGDIFQENRHGVTPLYHFVDGPHYTLEHLKYALYQGHHKYTPTAGVKKCFVEKMIAMQDEMSLIYLLDQKILDVNTIYNEQGHSLLHLAAKSGQRNMVDVILKYNPDQTVKDKQGKVAMDLLPKSTGFKKSFKKPPKRKF